LVKHNSLKIVVLFAVALVMVVAGCKDGSTETDLDKFIAKTEQLEGAAYDDTLAALAKGSDANAVYANYLIGNGYYISASDSAAVGGWNSKTVNADLDNAEIYFTKAVELDSTFIEAIVNLGSLWDDRSGQMGNRKERDHRNAQAEKFYKLALTVDPNDEKAHCNLGSLYLAQRRQGDAMKEFKLVIDNDPRSSLAHYHMAIMFAEAKIYREAIVEWELAAKYDSQGDIGQRSRDNIKIIEDLMNTEVPKH
jgi:tetratricopeptide (TPR) repeat protein